MNVLAHELRHMLDQSANVYATRNYAADGVALAEKLEKEKAAFVEKEAQAILDSPDVAKYFEAVTIASIRKTPSLANNPALPNAVNKFKQTMVKTGVESVLSTYIYHRREYERRGYLEQARYARVGQGWDCDHYLRSVTRDMPLELANQVGVVDYETLKSGERFSASVFPVPPSMVRYHRDLFESDEKLDVQT
jgi:hypothetical protein